MIRKVVSSLIDGTVSDGGSGDFRVLYTSLLDGASWHRPDHYRVLGDFRAYVDAKVRAAADYRHPEAYARRAEKAEPEVRRSGSSRRRRRSKLPPSSQG